MKTFLEYCDEQARPMPHPSLPIATGMPTFPPALYLRRIAIRPYPDGRSVALYRESTTGMVITIPSSG
jgi:hypothetical protein